MQMDCRCKGSKGLGGDFRPPCAWNVCGLIFYRLGGEREDNGVLSTSLLQQSLLEKNEDAHTFFQRTDPAVLETVGLEWGLQSCICTMPTCSHNVCLISELNGKGNEQKQRIYAEISSLAQL